MNRTRGSNTIIPAAENVTHPRPPWWRRIAATTAVLMWLLGAPAAPVHAAGCTNDGQNADDQPGQKDLSRFCNNGACGGGISYTWTFDDTDWNGNNTGDSCALYDTDNDGFANRVVCVTVEAGPTQQADNPKCYTCLDDAPDRCNGSALVACTSACTLQAQVPDPFISGDHQSNKCNGPNCETKDTQTSCCITAGDTGGGFLLDTCSYPSQQPNSAPSDCIINPPSCSTNADCVDANPCTVDTCSQTLGDCVHTVGNAGAQCRQSAGLCDEAEVCTGTSPECPTDLLLPVGTLCRGSTDTCDEDETCTGSSANCPADDVKPAGTPCRADGGQCDVAENCDGSSKACPADAFVPNNTPCSDSNACTSGDACTNGVCTPGGTTNCDDTNGCTDDGCDPSSGCTNVDNSDPCSDGNACTTGDACSGGSCVGGSALNCNDNNVCTDDSCNTQSGCVNANNTAPCSDSNECTDPDVCSAGSCVSGPEPNCDDSNACSTDSCDTELGCQNHFLDGCQPCATNANCQNATVCDGIEQCVDGKCQSGSQPDCDDHNDCTDDGCDPVDECTHLNNNEPCNDGNACTTADACSGGGCVGGPARNCNNNNVCITDGCEPTSGCTQSNNGNPCSDDDACTTDDTCSGGSCVGGAAPNCDDHNACTADSCDPASGCVNSNTTDPCDDLNGCTENDTCSGGLCESGSQKDCSDQNGCTDDSCSAPSGTCAHVDNIVSCDDLDNCTLNDICSAGECEPGAQKDCGDGNGCTTDSCDDPFGTCLHDPNANSCDDGNACTDNDVCGNSTCGGSTKDCNDGNGCTDDGCDIQTGCTNVNNNDPCSDGSACTTFDACSGGNCVGGPELNCNDNNVCTDDSCNTQSGCVNANNTAPCSDNDECTTPDVCGGGTCVSGGAPNCDDSNACSTDSCDTELGCQNHFLDGCQPCTTNANCQNATVCDGIEQCVDGKCQSGSEPNCDDQNDCTDDGCDPVHECRHLNNNNPCNDHDACTTADACSGGGCVGGPALNCNNNNVCTTDGCDPSSGCTHDKNTNPCSDDNECTTGDVCHNGTCGGSTITCDDFLACTNDSCDPDAVGGCVFTNNTDPCSDGDPCTKDDQCQGGLCGSVPRDCADLDPCSIDTCDNQGGGFLCVRTNCCSLAGQPCTDECVCPRCGNGVVEASAGETCDPPDATLIPGTENSGVPQPKCRQDCTYCGDGTRDPSEGGNSETCDDGNQVSGCDPKHPQRQLDACQINCTEPQCQDPARIVQTPGLDRFDVHTRLTTADELDFRDKSFIVEITDRSGVVLYRVSLEAGLIEGTVTRGRFKYANKDARRTGGLRKLRTTRHKGSYRITFQSYGDISAARSADMGTNIYLQNANGTAEWTLIAGDWEKTNTGWRFTGR